MQLLRIDNEEIFYDIQRKNIHMLSICKFYLEAEDYQKCSQIKDEANRYLDDYFFYLHNLLSLDLYV